MAFTDFERKTVADLRAVFATVEDTEIGVQGLLSKARRLGWLTSDFDPATLAPLMEAGLEAADFVAAIQMLAAESQGLTGHADSQPSALDIIAKARS